MRPGTCCLGRRKLLPRIGRLYWSICLIFATVGTQTFIKAGHVQKPGREATTTATATTQIRREVERFVELLSSNELVERTQGERGLLQLGPPALPFLPAPDVALDAAAREALRRVRHALEVRQARETVKASRVTLKGKLSLAAAVREIERQTGNRLLINKLPKAVQTNVIEPSLQEAPFWTALYDICQKGHIRWQSETTGETSSAIVLLVSEKREDRVEPIAVSLDGPFRISLISIAIRSLAGNDEQQLMRFNVAIHIEPRLRPLFLKFAAADIIATSENGADLPPFNPKAQYEIALGGGGSDLTVRFDRLVSKNEVPRKVNLRGKLSLMVAGGQERIEFDNAAGRVGVARRRGGVTVKLTKITHTPRAENRERQDLKLTARISYDSGGPAFESHRTWIFHNEAFLESPTGKRVEKSGSVNVSLHADGAVEVEFPFADIPKSMANWKFVYVAPTLILDVPIKVSFSKIEFADKPSIPKR